MYGTENKFIGKVTHGFQKSAWIELIGFDNAAPDFAVPQWLDTLGFTPDMVSLLMTTEAFALSHRGMEEEYVLPRYARSYSGHPFNDERGIQPWTNFQLRELVKLLKSLGIRVIMSVFELDINPPEEGEPLWSDAHPEVRVVDKSGENYQFLIGTKRFGDGTPFAEVLLERMLAVYRDYGIDGFQMGDGTVCRRFSLQDADFSDQNVSDFLQFSSIVLPDDMQNNTDGDADAAFKRARYIYTKHREKWIEFNTVRWREYLEYVIRGLKAEGVFIMAHSENAKNPVDAMFRYGCDYRTAVESGADATMFEEVSTSVSVLGNYEIDYRMEDTRRRFLHYEFTADLMAAKAYIPNQPIIIQALVRDTNEDWDILHTIPGMLPRMAYTYMNSYIYKPDGSLEPVTAGPHICLADALTPADWREIRLAWDNAYTEKAVDVGGATLIWSDARNAAEVTAFTRRRIWYTSKWHAELLALGCPVRKIARIENLDVVKGPILVTNPALMPASEREAVFNYKNGAVIYLGEADDYDLRGGDFFARAVNGWGEAKLSARNTVATRGTIESRVYESDDKPDVPPIEIIDENDASWEFALKFMPVDLRIAQMASDLVKKESNHPLVFMHDGEARVWEVMTSEKTSRIFVENDGFAYALPFTKIVGRTLKSVNYVTKMRGYHRGFFGDNGFGLRVSPRGCEIVEVEYE
ncbi:MAG: hypothetical protein LBD16_03865 [Oscillospiraceae bacterium]|jgi:hypothetical protein|nr:hypothetical protein [Oscillospiraceae bacterium]